MHAAAYLSNTNACLRLEAAVTGICELAFAEDWADLDRLIRELPIEVAIVDPVREDDVEAAAVERLRAYYPSLSVVLYMSFAPDLANALLRLGSLGVHSAVFFNHGDTQAELKRAVEEGIRCSVSELILARIFERMDVVSEEASEVADAFREALHNVDRIRTALEWSRFHGASHRSFYRLFQSHGLPTPKTCLLWLRLMYAAKLLEDPGYSLSDVVQRLGYSAPSNFWQHVQDTLGLRASELRYAVGFENLLDRFLTEHLEAAEFTEGSTG